MNAKGRHRALCKEKKKNKTMACSFNNHTSRVADGAVSKTKQCEFCSADEITCNASQARYHEETLIRSQHPLDCRELQHGRRVKGDRWISG